MAETITKERLTPWICRLSRLSTLFVGREMGRIGFGQGQFFLLTELYAEEGISQDELSRRVGVNKSNTSRALAKLKKFGLIRSKSDPCNHKVKKIYLEAKAYEIRKEFRNIQNEWNATLLSGFSENEKKRLLASLKKMARNAEASIGTALPCRTSCRNQLTVKKRKGASMELTDIISKEKWAHFEKELFDRFRMNCTVFDRSGTGVTGKPNWCNQLCPQIKANQNSLAAICAPGNQYFMATSKQTGNPVIGECDAGLVKIAVPIFVDGTFLGTAGGCGRLPQNGEVDTFFIGKAMGKEELEMAALCDGIEHMTEEQADKMADFIEKRLLEYVNTFIRLSIAAG